MTRLEDELRATFAARTAELPVLDDPAGRAIRHASRVRRRQTLLGSLAVLVTIGLVGIGVLQVPWQRGEVARLELATAQPSSMFIAATLGIRLDLRVGNQLWTADGRRLALPGAGSVTWIYRVPAGWVYGGSAGTLRMLYTDGAPADVDVPVDTAVVSADGQRIAWSTGKSPSRVLEFAELSGTGVDTVAKTSLAVAAEPVAIVGSAVVVGLPGGTGYSVWNPPGGFTGDSPVQLAGVYGDGGDGSLLGLDDAGDGRSPAPPAASPLAAKGVQIGRGSDAQVPDSGIVTEQATPTPTPTKPDTPVRKSSDGPCLIRYPMAAGRVVRKSLMAACGLGLAGGTAEGSASPDGQWLVAEASSGVIFVSLWAAEAGREPVVRVCPVRGRSAPVWEDPGTVLVASEDGLVRCGVDGSRRDVRIDGLPASGWSLVPAMGGR